jgi:hypothetical protein
MLCSFEYAGHYRDSSTEAPTTEVDWPHESVRVYPWAHAEVFHHVCQRPFGTICTVRTWLGDVASCRDCCRLAALAWVPSLWIRSVGNWSFTPPRKFARESLVVLPASQTCSAGPWSFAPPRRLARRGLGERLASQTCSAGTWSFARLADSLGGDLVGKWARERFIGLALGTFMGLALRTPFLGT